MLTWTTDKPTKPGWYWYRPYRDGQHVEVCRVYEIEIDYWTTIIPPQTGGEWAGPLEPPE